MKKTFKTEIRFNDRQSQTFHQSVGVCRWLYNRYVAHNKEQYQLYLDGKTDKKFLSANDFDKYINNEVKVLEEFAWIDTCGSKARKNRSSMQKRIQTFLKDSQVSKIQKEEKSRCDTLFS